MDFVVASSVLAGMMVYYGVYPSPLRLLVLPALLLLAMVAALGVSLWVSALNVAYRDVQYVLPFLIQMWLFATPAIYVSQTFHEPWRTLLGLNPMQGVVSGFRWALLSSGAPPGWMLAVGVGVSLLLSGSDRKTVTGSSGLIGSAVVEHLDRRGWRVHGVDNNMRREFFGEGGDTTWNLERLRATTTISSTTTLDVRDRGGDPEAVRRAPPGPDRPRRRAAQPRPRRGHPVRRLRRQRGRHAQPPRGDPAARARRRVRAPLDEQGLRRRAQRVRWPSSRRAGTTPTRPTRTASPKRCRIDRSKHSLFGASKVAADVMVQEYGRYFGLKTCCLRGGCLTGPEHSGVELHGFLSYLAKCAGEGRLYTIFGYKGKQVRDNIHSLDVARFMAAFVANPRAGEVYNLGGGRANSVSMLEAIDRFEELYGTPARLDLCRGAEAGRPHLLHQRPPALPHRLSGLGADDGPRRDLLRVRGEPRGRLMRVALVAHALPQPSSNGGPMTCWTILRELLDLGHEAAVVALRYPDDPFASAEREDDLRAEGAEVVTIPVAPEAQLESPAGTVPLRNRPSLERVFPAVRLRPVVEEALDDARPDAILLYHWEAIAATHGFRAAPRFGIVDDLWQLPNLRRWQHFRPTPTRAYAYWTLSTLRGLRPTRAAMGEVIHACEAAGSFQAQTAGELGVPYYPAPLPDPGAGQARARDGKLQTLGPSHLGATLRARASSPSPARSCPRSSWSSARMASRSASSARAIPRPSWRGCSHGPRSS